MNETKLQEEIDEQIAYDEYKSRLKPLYLLIKLDVDEGVVFDYDQASKYAINFCNNMEFELIDHCLEEEDNNDLYIGCADEVIGVEEEKEENEDDEVALEDHLNRKAGIYPIDLSLEENAEDDWL